MSETDYYEILRDLPRRREVWEVIAELYDNPEWMEAAVRVCRESGYSWDELDHIARYEVAPAIWFNWEYIFVASAYVCEPFFHPDWLAGRIVKRIGRRHHALAVKFLGRRMMRPLQENWREVERRFKSADNDNDGSSASAVGTTRPGN